MMAASRSILRNRSHPQDSADISSPLLTYTDDSWTSEPRGSLIGAPLALREEITKIWTLGFFFFHRWISDSDSHPVHFRVEDLG
jgi:hypothetical protein